MTSNVRVERRAAEYWMLALYPFRVRSNALLGGGLYVLDGNGALENVETQARTYRKRQKI